MNRKMRVGRCFLVTGIMILGLMLGMTCKKKNQPPGAPSIPSGPTSGRKGDSLRFSTIAEDPDGDSVAVRFDWGDSTRSDWSALVPNGDSVVMTHAWQRLSSYQVRAQAKDTRDTVSAWSSAHQLTIASFLLTLAASGGGVLLSVQQTTDGGYAAAGTKTPNGTRYQDVYLVKTDASGAQVCSGSFGGSCDDQGRSVEQTADGGYIITGTTYSYGAGNDRVYLVKADAEGNQMWSNTFGGDLSAEGTSVQQTTDGGYIVVGYIAGSGGGDVYLIKTDTSGNEVWAKTFGGSYDDQGFSVEQTADGGYIIAGYTHSFACGPSGAWLIKTDASGNRQWDKVLDGTFGTALSARQTPDGGYVVGGTSGGLSGTAWLIKTDASGSETWNQDYGDSGICGVTSVEPTSDGGYIFTGQIWSGTEGRYYVPLVRTDEAGRILWERRFGGSDDEEGYSVCQTSDGGYITCGFSDFYSGSYLIKTDADGN